jgi:hypothetical protein
MTYVISVTKQTGYTYLIDVQIFDNTGILVINGSISIVANAEDEAKRYAEEVYLPDLRQNFRELRDLVLNSEKAPVDELEVPLSDVPTDGGVADVEPTTAETV